MTNKDKILRYLECGLKVEAIDEEQYECIIYGTEEIKEDYEYGYYEERSLQFIVYEKTSGYLRSFALNSFEGYTITPIPLKPNYKPGDLVRILPIAREVEGYDKWHKEPKSMIDSGAYGVHTSGGNYLIYTKDKSDYWNFPSWTLAPAFPDEAQIDTHTGKEVTVTIDGKEYKAIIQ